MYYFELIKKKKKFKSLIFNVYMKPKPIGSQNLKYINQDRYNIKQYLLSNVISF